MPNWTKSPDLVMSGPVQEDPYGPHMGPYGPLSFANGLGSGKTFIFVLTRVYASVCEKVGGLDSGGLESKVTFSS